jgi:hypothetical protein
MAYLARWNGIKGNKIRILWDFYIETPHAKYSKFRIDILHDFKGDSAKVRRVGIDIAFLCIDLYVAFLF